MACYQKSSGSAGPTGPAGPAGDHYNTITDSTDLSFNTTIGSTFCFTVASGLAYITGNSVVIVNATNTAIRFEATVLSYDPVTGLLCIEDIVNAQGSIGTPSQWNINLDGIDGPTGPQGIQGVTGPTGYIGPTGYTGPTGLQGLQGPTGSIGAQGPQGIQGIAGPQGPQGPTGPVGSGPAFSLRASGSQQTSSATITKVTFGNVFDYNLGNYYNASNDTFLPLIPGYYQINTCVGIEPLSGNIAAAYITLYKNGSLWGRGSQSNALQSAIGLQLSTLVYLNGLTDFIDIRVLVSTSPASQQWKTTITDNNTWINGYLARAA